MLGDVAQTKEEVSGTFTADWKTEGWWACLCPHHPTSSWIPLEPNAKASSSTPVHKYTTGTLSTGP